MLPIPLNLQAWIEEHRHLLKPPVGNNCIYDGEFIVMVVGGPNTRTDYHWDAGPEWFYHLEGELLLRIQIGCASCWDRVCPSVYFSVFPLSLYNNLSFLFFLFFFF